MSDDLKPLREWIGGLIGALEPGERKKLNRRVAIAVRRSNADRIGRNVDPDGNAFAPRKPRESAAAKRKGRIRERKMFLQARKASYLKKRWTADSAGAEFSGAVGRIMRVHQFGLADRVSRNGPKVRYPARRLLGFNVADETEITDLILEHFAKPLS